MSYRVIKADFMPYVAVSQIRVTIFLKSSNFIYHLLNELYIYFVINTIYLVNNLTSSLDHRFQ